MAQIELSMPYVLENEGGFVIDDGGPTNYGITEAALSLFLNQPVVEEDIKNLTVDLATQVYKKNYWDALNLDLVNDQNIATCIFDTGVNRGVSIGAKYAQRVCNALGGNLSVDGQIGPKTILDLNCETAQSFIPVYESMVQAGYEAIVAQDPARYGRYLAGWMNRAHKLLTLI